MAFRAAIVPGPAAVTFIGRECLRCPVQRPGVQRQPCHNREAKGNGPDAMKSPAIGPLI
jgi:hypothetical protein